MPKRTQIQRLLETEIEQLNLKIDLNKIGRHLRKESHSSTSLGGMIKGAFLGSLFFSALPIGTVEASANRDLAEKNETSKTTLEAEDLAYIVKNISSSNEHIREYNAEAGRDFIAVGLAYIERCNTLKDAKSCMEAGLYIYNKLIPELIKQKKEIPGSTIPDLKVKAIHAFMVRAANLAPSNPVYLTLLGLALIAENSMNTNYDGYDLLLEAYKYNRQVAGIAKLLADKRNVKELLANYELLTRILDPNEGEYFKKDVLKEGEKILLSLITRKRTAKPVDENVLEPLRKNIL
jgi:hypothetical protein